MFNFFKYTEAKLAEDLIDICSKLLPTDKFEYDVENHSVRSDQHNIFLGNIFEQVKDKNRSQRLAYLEEFLQSALGEQEISYDASSHLLMPRVKSYGEMHAWCELLSMKSVDEFPHQRLTDNFVCMLSLDRANSIHSVTREDLEKMEMTVDEAFKHAMANLQRRSETAFDEINKGLYVADFQDGHNAARVLLTEQIQNLHVNGDPVVFLPTNDELVICGSEDTEYFEQLAGQCLKLVQETKPLSFDTMVLKDGQWHDFYPGKTFENAPIYNLHLIEQSTQYADQKVRLEDELNAQGLDIFVASHTLFERTDAPFYFSVCTWTEDVHSLLPMAEQVHFVVPKGMEDTEVLAILTWQETIENFGHLMTPMGKVPERFEVNNFPDKEQLLKVISTF